MTEVTFKYPDGSNEVIDSQEAIETAIDSLNDASFHRDDED